MRAAGGTWHQAWMQGGRSTFKERTGSVSQKGTVADIHGAQEQENTRTFSGGLRCFGKLQSPLRRPVLLPPSCCCACQTDSFLSRPPQSWWLSTTFFPARQSTCFILLHFSRDKAILATNAKFNYWGNCGGYSRIMVNDLKVFCSFNDLNLSLIGYL